MSKKIITITVDEEFKDSVYEKASKMQLSAASYIKLLISNDLNSKK